MHRSKPKPGLSYMDKKVPKNNKYSHVYSKLDTGITVDKVKFITARESALRRDEIFFRLTPKQLYQLYNEYEREESETISEAGNYGSSSSSTYHSFNNTSGPRIVTHLASSKPVYERPYLILDVRDVKSYKSNHLLQARSFPYTELRKDKVHPELYNFRNKSDSLIIIYCDNEQISKDTAKLLVDRGTDNIYLLTGGMSEFSLDYPSFIEGDDPLPVVVDSPKRRHQRRTVLTQVIEDDNATSFSSSPRSSRPPLTGRSNYYRDDISESGRSTQSNLSIAESVISRSQSRKGRF